MKQGLVFWTLALFGLVSFPLQARLFDFKEKGFSATLDGSFGSTLMNQDAFAANLGNQVSMSKSLDYMQGAKIGFAYNAHETLNFGFGVEILKPLSIKGAPATNLSGTELYAFSSSALVLNPVFSLEYSYSKIKNVRYFFGLGAGFGQLSMDNQFEMTGDGQAELGVDSYTEKLKGRAFNGYASIGLEAHFVDTTTFVVQAGHRVFKFHELEHGSSVTTLSEGAVAEGDPVYNADGSKRKLDLSGSFISVGFRFYIP